MFLYDIWVITLVSYANYLMLMRETWPSLGPEALFDFIMHNSDIQTDKDKKKKYFITFKYM